LTSRTLGDHCLGEAVSTAANAARSQGLDMDALDVEVWGLDAVAVLGAVEVGLDAVAELDSTSPGWPSGRASPLASSSPSRWVVAGFS
jgi:hypothetical protein